MLTESRHSLTPLVKPGISVFGYPTCKLRKNQELCGNGIKFFRMASDDPHPGQIATDGDDLGFLIGASQTPGHRRHVVHDDQTTSFDFDSDSIYIRNLAAPYRADLEGPFDFLMMELSPRFLRDMAEEHGWRYSGNLTTCCGCSDPVLSSLLRAAQPALERTEKPNLIFVDQLGLAISIYLFERYGAAPAQPRRGRELLSKPQMMLASEMVRSHPEGKISIAELAAACGLSRGYFIHAFKSTTGSTPHQWMLSQRVEQARDLLKNSNLALAEVGLMCGFADQSHFTRVFSRMTGTSPGHWRRSVATRLGPRRPSPAPSQEQDPMKSQRPAVSRA